VADYADGLQPLLEELMMEGDDAAYIKSVLATLQRTSYRSDTMLAPAMSDQDTGTTDMPSLYTLSLRELEVLRLLAIGLTNKEIGTELSISPRTVQKHTIRIYQKLEVNNRSQAAMKFRAFDLDATDVSNR
jgi:DNA-binding NarL/FixJ family response regulator